MARAYRQKENDPGQLITSPAFRALETAMIFALEFDIDPVKIRMESDLYYKGDLNILLTILKSISDETNIITLFGHNPAFTQMADRLAVEGCEFMTKTSIVCISFNSNTWKGIKPDTGKIEYFLKPEKNL